MNSLTDYIVAIREATTERIFKGVMSYKLSQLKHFNSRYYSHTIVMVRPAIIATRHTIIGNLRCRE